MKQTIAPLAFHFVRAWSDHRQGTLCWTSYPPVGQTKYWSPHRKYQMRCTSPVGISVNETKILSVMNPQTISVTASQSNLVHIPELGYDRQNFSNCRMIQEWKTTLLLTTYASMEAGEIQPKSINTKMFIWKEDADYTKKKPKNLLLQKKRLFKLELL